MSYWVIYDNNFHPRWQIAPSTNVAKHVDECICHLYSTLKNLFFFYKFILQFTFKLYILKTTLLNNKSKAKLTKPSQSFWLMHAIWLYLLVTLLSKNPYFLLKFTAFSTSLSSANYVVDYEFHFLKYIIPGTH